LADPLYPSYISRALATGLLSPGELLQGITLTIREAQGLRENTRYPLIRLINQAFTLWKPNEKNVEDRNLLWTVEGVLHTFVTDEGLLQDQVLFIETFDIWNHLLTAQSLRPLFATEREKSQGDSRAPSLYGLISAGGLMLMVEKWKSFEGDLQDLRTSTGTKLPMTRTTEFETVLAQFLVDLNTSATATASTTAGNGLHPPIVTELPKFTVLETRAALPILFISLVCFSVESEG